MFHYTGVYIAGASHYIKVRLSEVHKIKPVLKLVLGAG